MWENFKVCHICFFYIKIATDIVPELIEENAAKYGIKDKIFQVMDITSDPIPKVDLILSRDLFIHFSNNNIWKAINNIKKDGATYLLTTTDRDYINNYDILTGSAHEINLNIDPFNFPEAILYLKDYPMEGFVRSLGLWKIADLPNVERSGEVLETTF